MQLVAHEPQQITIPFSSQHLRVHSCPKFTDFLYQRTFTLYVIDIYGRYSNVIKKRLEVKTSVFMYTNAKPLIITNAADLTKIRITQSLYDPVRQDSNITSADAEEVYAFTKDILGIN